MKVICKSGFYLFNFYSQEEKAIFEGFCGLKIVDHKSFFTFEYLADLPNYCLKGQNYGNLTAKLNFEGEPYLILEKNNFIYDYDLNYLVKPNEVKTKNKLIADNCFLGLLKSGTQIGNETIKNWLGTYIINEDISEVWEYESF
jgi:hypothetical protein